MIVRFFGWSNNSVDIIQINSKMNLFSYIWESYKNMGPKGSQANEAYMPS